MYITTTELNKDLGKYLALSATEEIYVTHKGKVVAKLTNSAQSKTTMAESIFGFTDDNNGSVL